MHLLHVWCIRRYGSLLVYSENRFWCIRKLVTKKKCLNDCLDQRRHFTSFVVVSCEGLLGKEGSTFLKRHGKRLPDKWNQPYSTTISFVRKIFAIALVRAKNRCFRCSRIYSSAVSHKYNWDDGVGLNLYSALQ